MRDKYRAYTLRGVRRVNGPGIDVYPGYFDSPGLLAHVLNIAYEEGRQSANKRRKK